MQLIASGDDTALPKSSPSCAFRSSVRDDVHLTKGFSICNHERFRMPSKKNNDFKKFKINDDILVELIEYS